MSDVAVKMFKPRGPLLERETTVVFNQESSEAEVWTGQKGVYKKLLRRGWMPKEVGDRGAMFVVPKKLISFRRVKDSNGKSKTAKGKSKISNGRQT